MKFFLTREGRRQQEMSQMAEEQEQAMGIKHPGIEAENNHIFFYSEVDDQKILFLRKLVMSSELNAQMTKLQLGLDTEIPIHLHIQSYGGSLTTAFGMYDVLCNLKVPLVTYVEGHAASAGTVLAMAGTKRLITKNSLMLIHELRSGLFGKFSDMEEQMENCNLMMSKIKTIYLSKTKISSEELDEVLKKDKWFDSDTCLKHGLVDAII